MKGKVSLFSIRQHQALERFALTLWRLDLATTGDKHYIEEVCGVRRTSWGDRVTTENGPDYG